MSVDPLGMGKQLERDQVATREKIAGSIKPSVRHENAPQYSRSEVINEEGDQISRVETTQIEPHVEPLISHLNGTIWSDGVINAEKKTSFSTAAAESP